MNQKTKHVVISKELHRELKILAARLDLKLTKLIEKGLKTYLNEYETKSNIL